MNDWRNSHASKIRVSNSPPEERAVLAFTESVTLVCDTHVPGAVYEEVSRYSNQNQIAQILMTIVTINAWNRIGVATRMVPGTYSVTTG